MGEVKNLTRQEANQKIKAMAEKTDVCLFTTNLSSLPLTTRPMSTRAVDEEGNIWFFSREGSSKNNEIEQDDRVQLFYSNNIGSEYLTIYGRASISKDAAKAKELWSAIARTWFYKGYDDPELTLVKVVPEDGHYWDTKDGKIISLFKMVAGAIMGKELVEGVEGDIKV
ncbi:MAG TPA: pyridoxamine 5'-phosphate oxidase family protein [Chitinophagaceae bacterium]|nr:pyridoxamine 5'-phosphate oxidase family protein [Chitinophagaceae bacterium]